MSPRSPLRRAILPRSISIAQAAYNRRDWSAAIPGYDPEAQVIPPRAWTEMGDFDPVYRGREGLVRYYRQWIESWPNIRVEPQEVIDFGGRVFLRGQTTAAGAISGIELTGPYFQLFHVRDGLVTRDQTFLDESEALEAARLWE